MHVVFYVLQPLALSTSAVPVEPICDPLPSTSFSLSLCLLYLVYNAGPTAKSVSRDRI